MTIYHRTNTRSSYEFVIRNTQTGEVVWQGFTPYKGSSRRLVLWMLKPMASGGLLIDKIAALTNTDPTRWETRRKAEDGMHCLGTPWEGVWTGRTAYQINGTRDCPRTAPAPAAQ